MCCGSGGGRQAVWDAQEECFFPDHSPHFTSTLPPRSTPYCRVTCTRTTGLAQCGRRHAPTTTQARPGGNAIDERRGGGDYPTPPHTSCASPSPVQALCTWSLAPGATSCPEWRTSNGFGAGVGAGGGGPAATVVQVGGGGGGSGHRGHPLGAICLSLNSCLARCCCWPHRASPHHPPLPSPSSTSPIRQGSWC